MDRYLIAIGGGSLQEKSTLKIDAFIADLAKKRAGDKRAVGVFIGTASHDSMPYFNTFRKTYTAEFNIKADCVLSVYGEMNDEKIKTKFEKADLIYIGGGDTLFMLDWWKQKGILNYLFDAYDRGVIIAGLSAGAICWFDKMYTDSEFFNKTTEYSIHSGLGILQGICCPHYDERATEFDKEFLNCGINLGYAIEANSAVVFKNGNYSSALTCGGNSYRIENVNGEAVKTLLN